jgi:subtilisin
MRDLRRSLLGRNLDKNEAHAGSSKGSLSMSKFLVTNRRAGLFTDATKHASRASVATTLSALGSSAKVLSDHAPPDPLARRVVVVEADAGHVAALRASLGPHALIEPLVYHHLHDHRRPAFLRRAVPLAAHALRGDHRFGVTVTGHGQPLAGADVLVYVANAFGNISNTTIKADAHGHVSVNVPARRRIVAVEPIPYASCWIMLADAPVDGATIDCPAIPKATASGSGWWHEIMGVDTGAGNRGKGIAVGVIDTGCGPHANLAHVNLVGAFVDGDVQLGAAHGTDVAEHGTHTTGIIGARPTRAGDFAGMAPDCTLFHARVFKSEDEGPSSADLINAIDSLSRNHGCDLINMSLGGGGPTQAEEDAIRDAAERGTLCVCSAGNETAAIEFPGAYPECAAVSAVGMLGTVPAGSFSAGNRPQDPEKIGTDNLFLAAFSCFADGPGQALACCAPGVGIISTVPDKGDLRDLYMEMDGTSMASPAACGALAVILGQSDDYKALPRDVTRSDAARLLLRQHCRSIGLDPQFEGAGLPQV